MEADIEICGEAADGPKALARAQELRPDVILLDISMPGMSGFEVTRLLRRELPEMKILVMTQNDPVLFAPAVREAGADGLLDKSCLATDLIPAIERLQNALLPSERVKNSKMSC